MAVPPVLDSQALRQQNIDGLSDQFFTRVAELILDLGVDHHQPVVGIDQHHPARTGLHCQSEHLPGDASLSYENAPFRAANTHRDTWIHNSPPGGARATAVGFIVNRETVTNGLGDQKRQLHPLETAILRTDFSHQMRAMAFERPVAGSASRIAPSLLEQTPRSRDAAPRAHSRRQTLLTYDRGYLNDRFALLAEPGKASHDHGRGPCANERVSFCRAALRIASVKSPVSGST
jgi:hypothetical protein